MNSFSFAISTVLVLLSVQNIFAINLESSKEQGCVPINKTADVDMKWLMSVKEWYYPVMSRLDLFLTVLELTGTSQTPAKLPESQVYYESCIKLKIVGHGDKLQITGFNGRQIVWGLDYPVITDAGLKYRKLTLLSGYAGKAYTTLTDNATFSLFVVCWEDNQVTWGVMSTIDKLPRETMKVIYDHVESLGLKRDYFEEIRYGYCNK